MRITSDYAEAIKQAAAEHFGAGAVVRLFGSRADDGKRGGDVDLHVELARKPADWRAKYGFMARIEERTGDERKIDLVLYESGAPLRPIDQIALREGIVL
jgi:predicted nucleotidyltransferase